MNELDALLVLNAIPALANNKIRKMMDYFGSAKAVYEKILNPDGLEGFVSQKVTSQMASFPVAQFLANEKKSISARQIQVLTYNDNNYPERLREIPDAPVVLYVWGNVELLHEFSIGIVGSRKASTYGKNVALKFAMRFSEVGVPVVSGLARGIDAFAHTGSLRGVGSTVAVLGSGLNQLYPADNRALAFEIAKKGAVISEFPMDTPPFAYNFPRRNRIVSGLSMGVIVVEAAKRSGALITADYALEQGREVYATPGPIDIPASQGAHHLIKQGAKLVTCVEDVLEDLKPHLLDALDESEEEHDNLLDVKVELTEQEEYIIKQLKKQPVHIDELVMRCKIQVPLAVSLLTQLEIKQAVKKHPGQYYTRIFFKN